MNDSFSPSVAAALADGARRQESAEAAAALGLPSSETEEWRYSLIGDLDLDKLAPVTDEPAGGSSNVDRYDAVRDRAATVVIVDGWPVEVDIDGGWAQKGLSITVAHGREAVPDGEVSADEERTLFDVLHEAFSPGMVTVQVPTGLTVGAPIVIVNHQASVDRATFPHVIVDAGDGSDVSVVERQTSVEGFGLSVPLVELRAQQAARLRYETVQILDRQHWQLARLRSSADSQAMLVSGVAAFGAPLRRWPRE